MFFWKPEKTKNTYSRTLVVTFEFQVSVRDHLAESQKYLFPLFTATFQCYKLFDRGRLVVACIKLYRISSDFFFPLKFQRRNMRLFPLGWMDAPVSGTGTQ